VMTKQMMVKAAIVLAMGQLVVGNALLLLQTLHNATQFVGTEKSLLMRHVTMDLRMAKAVMTHVMGILQDGTVLEELLHLVLYVTPYAEMGFFEALKLVMMALRII